jgi:RNA polymerase sigma-70 factor (ECF subfamily)
MRDQMALAKVSDPVTQHPQDPGQAGPKETVPTVGTATAKDSSVVDLRERAWLPRHCRGDETAFAELVECYRRPLYGYFRRSGLSQADADDIFQSTFLNIHKAAASYQPTRPLAPWIFAIAANCLRNHFRRKAPDQSSLDDPETPALADNNPSPERWAADRQALGRLEGAIAQLPESQREVLTLVTFAGLTHDAIAQALGLPLNTVKTQLRRARLKLAAEMARHRPDGAAPQTGTQPAAGTGDVT